MKNEFWYKKHPGRTIFILVFISCIVILFLTEFLARMFIPSLTPDREERSKFWRYDSLIGWSHIPGQTGRFNHRDFSVAVRINKEGLRDREYSFIRNEKKRMLILGDSFGWGFGVEEDDRFSEIIEKSNAHWEIINASVSGYGTDQEYIYLKDRGINFHPDVVLVLFNVSDFTNNTQKEQYWYNKPYFVLENNNLVLRNIPVPKPIIKKRIQCYLYGRTYLGVCIQKAKQILSNSISQRRKNIQKSIDSEKSNENQYTYEMTKTLIIAMNRFCSDQNIKFVLVSTPMDSASVSFFEKMACSENISYLKLDSYHSLSNDDTHFKHDGHWNRLGNKIAAEAINDFLHKNKIM